MSQDDKKPPIVIVVTVEPATVVPVKLTATVTFRGPAKVSSDAFRAGWENIFGAKRVVGQA